MVGQLRESHQGQEPSPGLLTAQQSERSLSPCDPLCVCVHVHVCMCVGCACLCACGLHVCASVRGASAFVICVCVCLVCTGMCAHVHLCMWLGSWLGSCLMRKPRLDRREGVSFPLSHLHRPGSPPIPHQAAPRPAGLGFSESSGDNSPPGANLSGPRSPGPSVCGCGTGFVLSPLLSAPWPQGRCASSPARTTLSQNQPMTTSPGIQLGPGI